MLVAGEHPESLESAAWSALTRQDWGFASRMSVVSNLTADGESAGASSASRLNAVSFADSVMLHSACKVCFLAC